MRRYFMIAMLFLAVLCVSCSKDDGRPAVPEEKEGGEAAVSLRVITGEEALTKASGSGHGDRSLDDRVNTLDVFIFRNGETDRGKFEMYHRFDAARLAEGLDNLEIKATTGPKTIYVVCNSHRGFFPQINRINDFRRIEADLKMEDCMDFVMVGSADVVLSTTTSVTVKVKRLVSRVILSDVHTAFGGTPYEGMELTDVKAYLINVKANKLLADNEDCVEVKYVNHGRFDAASCYDATMPDMFFDRVADRVGGGNALGAPLYFYAFENIIEREDPRSGEWFTRLVIEAVLDGVKYYYPINVNRDGFGYAESSMFRQGIERNRSYELRVEISRIGSDSPNEPLDFGVVSVNAVVSNWGLMPVTDVVL